MKADPHWLWLLLALAVVGWYSTVTIWVAIKGVTDIREMVRKLDRKPAKEDPPAAE